MPKDTRVTLHALYPNEDADSLKCGWITWIALRLSISMPSEGWRGFFFLLHANILAGFSSAATLHEEIRKRIAGFHDCYCLFAHIWLLFAKINLQKISRI